MEDYFGEFLISSQKSAAKQMLQDFVDKFGNNLNYPALASELLHESLVSWYSHEELSRKLSFFRRKSDIEAKKQIFVSSVSKTGFNGLYSLIRLFRRKKKLKKASHLDQLFQNYQFQQSRNILFAFFNSAGGRLFDPRMVSNYLSKKHANAMSLYDSLKNEESRRIRIQLFQEKYPNNGFLGIYTLLEALRAYKLSFEAIYLHLLIRGESNIEPEEVTVMATEASMENQLWTEGWESIPRIRERLQVKSRRTDDSGPFSLALIPNSRSKSFTTHQRRIVCA